MRRAAATIFVVACFVACARKPDRDEGARADPEAKPAASSSTSTSTIATIADAGDNGEPSFGYGGLGMSSGPIDDDAGDWGDGVGLGTVGGFGGSSGSIGSKTKAKSNTTDAGLVVDGKLAIAIVRRIVRANFPRYRACFENALKQTPKLAGTVVVQSIIDSTGAVESASSKGGTLSNAAVVACVVGVFRTLSFPEPESGKVTMTETLEFEPIE